MRVLTISLSLVVLLSASVRSQENSATADPLSGLRGSEKLRVLVQTVVEHQRALKTLRAHFLQKKHSGMLLNDEISEGEFLFMAPDHVRWNYESPKEMVVCFSGTRLWTWRPGEGAFDEVEISRKNRRFVKILAGTQPLDELKSQFEMSLKDPGAPGPYELKLKPTHRSLAKKLDRIELKIDRKLYVPISFRMVEADGDTTLYVFSDMELNPELDPRSFEMKPVSGDVTAAKP